MEEVVLKLNNFEGPFDLLLSLIEKNKMNRVECPDCNYKMPIFFSDKAECTGVMVSCKGRNCHSIFEVKIKHGKQIK